MVGLSENAKTVLESRYLRQDASGRIIESPEELFARVARHVAQRDKTSEKPFLDMLSQFEFLPNSPTLSNAGTQLNQLAACFVLPVEDSLEEIFDALKLMALVQQSGGGTGFSFSRLRQKGSRLGRSGGISSGPVSFMKIFDSTTEHIRQGGRRRGANMGVLSVDHPDIMEFIESKMDGKTLQNFNISVGMTDSFMERVTTEEKARSLFSKLCLCAWKTGDPGLVFVDAIHRTNPLPDLGRIEATNPCGEVPLLPYEACTLGSINLTKVVSSNQKSIDWEKLMRITRLGIRFLDNVVEINEPPSPKIKAMIQSNRKLGLGVMGFAELCILLEIPYGSPQCIKLAEEVMKAISDAAWNASEALAAERGVFPNWERSVFGKSGKKVRNATCSSIAPTGTISLIADTSSGIEPLFALAHRRFGLDGKTLVDLNKLFKSRFENDPKLIDYVTTHGNLSGAPGVSKADHDLFRTALELPPQEHLEIQSAFQKHVDNAVSKTINLPETATPEDIETCYLAAWKMGLKGVTVFRYGSKASQVLELGLSNPKCEPEGCKL